MPIEIERKFLVTNNTFINESYAHHYIEQGFLNSNKNRVVRIRIVDQKAFLTIKGITNKTGTTRFEWEKEISIEDGKQLMLLTESTPIKKTRYLVKNGHLTFEIDVFKDSNQGLIVAEIELPSENETFEIPNWLGKEVTGDPKYFNSQISLHPFTDWPKKT